MGIQFNPFTGNFDITPAVTNNVILNNDEYLKSKDSTDTTTINIVKVNSSNIVEFAQLPIGPLVAPTLSNEFVNKAYIDSVLTNLVTTYVVLNQLTAPPVGPTLGDAYLVIATATGAWAGKEKDIATWNGSSWIFTTSQIGNRLVDLHTNNIYVYSGVTWILSTEDIDTASNGCIKVGDDIQIDPNLAGEGLSFSVGVLTVIPDDVGIEHNVAVLHHPLRLKDGGVVKEKINSSALGNGLTGGSGVVISVLPDTTGGANLAKSVNVSANGLAVKIDSTTIDTNVSNQLEIKALGVGTAQIAAISITKAKLGSDILGNGLTGANGSAISVLPDAVGGAGLATVIDVNANGVALKIDGSTLSETVTGKLQVANLGVGTAQIAGTSITKAKLGSDILGNGLTGANGSAISVLADNTGGAGLSPSISVTSSGLTVKVDNATIGPDLSSQLQVIDGSIGTTKITGLSITKALLGDDILGDGLTGANGSAISVLSDATGGANLAKSVNVSANGLAIKIDSSSIDTNVSNQLEIKALGVTTAKLAATSVTAAKLGSDILGNGLTGANGSAISVLADPTGSSYVARSIVVGANGVGLSIDNATIVETPVNFRLKVADLAISTAKLAATAVTAAKLGLDVAGNGLTGGNGAAIAALSDVTGGANLAKSINVSANGLAIKVDGTTVAGNGSNQLGVIALSIGTAQLTDLGVTTGKLAANAVDSTKALFSTSGNGINSQTIPANYTAVNYTPAQVGSEGAAQISSHLKGIDTKIATLFTIGDIPRTQWASLANNTANQTITGFAFGASVLAFEAIVAVEIIATANRYQSYKLYAKRTGVASWAIATVIGDGAGANANTTFAITTGGQVQCSTANSAGFVSGTVTFRATVL